MLPLCMGHLITWSCPFSQSSSASGHLAFLLWSSLWRLVFCYSRKCMHMNSWSPITRVYSTYIIAHASNQLLHDHASIICTFDMYTPFFKAVVRDVWPWNSEKPSSRSGFHAYLTLESYKFWNLSLCNDTQIHRYSWNLRLLLIFCCLLCLHAVQWLTGICVTVYNLCGGLNNS